jgi:glycosyltransferase involved in cell wall biosynthesis
MASPNPFRSVAELDRTPDEAAQQPSGGARVLCLASHLWGNRTFAARVSEALRANSAVQPEIVAIERADYALHAAPRWVKWSQALEAEAIARRKLRGRDLTKYDAIIVTTWDLLPAIGSVTKRTPTAVAMDTTPAAAWRVMVQSNTQRAMRALVSEASFRLNDLRFRRAIERIAVFLPMTPHCAESLVRDYGVDPKLIRVSWTPLDLDAWRPASAPVKRDRLRVLFVGNDVVRKGLATALAVFGECGLGQDYDLAVVSTDPRALDAGETNGVAFIGSVPYERLPQVYAESDLVLLPTIKDYSPHVLAEAAASGIPAVVSDVGGTRDMVTDGVTGRLLPVHTAPARWAELIRSLLSDREALEAMGRAARRGAEQRLGIPAFQQLMDEVVMMLSKTGAQRRAQSG